MTPILLHQDFNRITLKGKVFGKFCGIYFITCLFLFKNGRNLFYTPFRRIFPTVNVSFTNKILHRRRQKAFVRNINYHKFNLHLFRNYTLYVNRCLLSGVYSVAPFCKTCKIWRQLYKYAVPVTVSPGFIREAFSSHVPSSSLCVRVTLRVSLSKLFMTHFIRCPAKNLSFG